MYKKRITVMTAGLLAAALLLAACAGRHDVKADIGRALGLDLSAAEVTASSDDHDSFLGDGTSLVTLRLPDDALADTLATGPAWQPLPLADDALTALLYGRETADARLGPYLTGADGTPLLPVVADGFVRFIDRHADAADPTDAAAALTRKSCNFTVALYDAAARTLYYAALDT